MSNLITNGIGYLGPHTIRELVNGGEIDSHAGIERILRALNELDPSELPEI